METKFTPGPWHVELGEFIYVCSSETVCDVTTVVNLAIGQDANANLIAAAPDLYKQLKETHAALCMKDPEYIGSLRYDLNRLALDKALGENND